MQRDHTNEVEKRVEAIRVTALDSCSFYSPKDGSFTSVKLCVYCKYSKFAENDKNGFCKYPLVNTGVKQTKD